MAYDVVDETHAGVLKAILELSGLLKNTISAPDVKPAVKGWELVDKYIFCWKMGKIPGEVYCNAAETARLGWKPSNTGESQELELWKYTYGIVGWNVPWEMVSAAWRACQFHYRFGALRWRPVHGHLKTAVPEPAG